jgi:hypothetical protein
MKTDIASSFRSRVVSGLSLHTKARGNEHVSAFSLIFNTNVTYGRKSLLLYPLVAVPGCVSDDKRLEPGSWCLIAMFPTFPIRQQKMLADNLMVYLAVAEERLHHLCLKECMVELSEISVDPIQMQWTNQEWLWTYIVAAAVVVDQNEQDLLCCEPSQRCMTCPCPRELLHEPPSNAPARRGRDVQKAVLNAAFKSIVPW